MGDSESDVKPTSRRMKPAPSSMTSLPPPEATTWDIMKGNENRRASFQVDEYADIFELQQRPEAITSTTRGDAGSKSSTSTESGVAVEETAARIEDAASSVTGSGSEPFRFDDDLEKLLSEESDGMSLDQSKNWDVFGQSAMDNDLDMEGCWMITLYICKVLTYIFLFAMVFGGATISIGTVVFAAGNIYENPVLNETSTPNDSPISVLACVSYTSVSGRSSDTMASQNYPNEDILYAETSTDDISNTSPTTMPENKTTTIPPPSGSEKAECLALPRGWERNDTETLDCLRNDADVYYTQMCDTVAVQWIWCLFLIIVTPYGLVFLRCFWMVMFRRKKLPSLDALMIVLLVDTLYVTGVCMLAFVVLPLLDNVIQMAMVMMGVGLTPAIMTTVQRLLHRDFYSQENERNDEVQDRKRFILRLSLDILALLCQIIGLITWSTVGAVDEEYSKDLTWSVPVSLSLISLGYWENYVDLAPYIGIKTRNLPLIPRMRKRIRQDYGVVLRLISSFWKMVVALLMTMAFVSVHGIDMQTLFSFDTSECGTTISHDDISSLELDWVWVWLTNTGAAFVCYFGARTAAKILVQSVSYALPLCLATPCAMVFLGLGCYFWNDNPCSYTDGLPSYVFFRCQAQDGYDWMTDMQIWLIITWAVSQLWLTWHIWWQKNEKLAPSDKLFEQPLYDGLLLQQSLLYNRNRNERKELNASYKPSMNIPNWNSENEPSSKTAKTLKANDSIPMIYICATMWHETATEMEMMMRSVLKLDKDQAIRRLAQEDLGKEDPSYYEFEAHIFFDDAMEYHNRIEHRANEYVRTLVKSMNKAARDVHHVQDMTIPAPIKYSTPYGGRLEWTMPGGNKVIAHLKDKQKARHKKRWSQVMYMYYFLGFKLMANDFSDKRKEVKANNTMLLALDGDVDFEPKSLVRLVDLMKRNSQVGAACGRIHPVGTGPMMWYQLFEYALGHWLQKAAEHVFGCVLCSPGCFSLFRGSALMEKNVMNKYTTKAEEPSHFVQYDQGEDRWLCTLLLQAGFKVEYSAAADARTFAPEGFYEFYRQRRRWGPSSMANIIDLLMSWKHTTRVNDYISVPYVLYQTMVFVFSLFGTGTIFLMIVGALEVALGWNLEACIILNLIPVTVFVILCFVAKDETQLLTALILTALYAMLQMIVLIGIIIQMIEEGWCSPTTLFFFYVAGTFLLAALLHPQEFFCVCHGFTYFLAIPSMYMLLTIYSICNLHVVSWGTRETPKSKEEIERDEERARADPNDIPEKQDEAKAFLLPKTTTKGIKWSCGTLCSCLCCTEKIPFEDEPQVMMTKKMFEVRDKKIDEISQLLVDIDEKMSKTVDARDSQVSKSDSGEADSPWFPRRRESNWLLHKRRMSRKALKVNFAEPSPDYYDDHMRPPNPLLWIEDEELGSGQIGQLPASEIEYFNDFIEEYLKPLESDKAKEERIAAQLKELRNKMSAGFLLGNAMLVITLLVLQLNELFVPWFCEDLYLEPISFVFLIFYAFVMFLQTIGMLIHRIGTFLHYMASQTLPCCRELNDKSLSISTADLKDQANLCRLDREDDEVYDLESNQTEDLGDEFEAPQSALRRRGTVHNITQAQRTSKKAYTTMSKAHAERIAKEVKRFEHMSKEELEEEKKKRESSGRYTLRIRPNRSMYDRRLSRGFFDRQSFQVGLKAGTEDNRASNGSTVVSSSNHSQAYDNPIFMSDTTM